MKNLLLTLLVLFSTGAFADPVYLVTFDEMVQSNNHKLGFEPKFAPEPGAPIIDLISPKIDGLVATPTPIKLKFEAQSPSIIKPESFRIYYGSFQIDVTERLLGAAKIEPSGFSVQEAVLPKGSHKLTLNIMDSEGRIGKKTVEFEVK